MALPVDAVFVIFGVLLMLVCYTSGQLCLDSMSPFIPTSPLSFCAQSSKYGCCTSDDDASLRQMYDSVRRSILQDDDTRSDRVCLQHFRYFLCAKCSPFSAELFQGSITRFGEPLIPGLCSNFCDHFYKRCSRVTEHYLGVLADIGTSMNAAFELNALTNSARSTQFCNAVSLSAHKSQYCEPNARSPFRDASEFTTDKVNTADCVCLQPYSISLTNPVAVVNGDDETNRLFIAEQNGVVKVMFSDGSSQNTFLDIRSKVFHDGDGFSQLGLLGMALHPKFKENHKLYVFYTFKKTSLYVRVEEYRANADNTRADLNTNKVILEFKKDSNEHAGGPLLFGKDGFLYIFTGDDGGDRDAMETSQDLFMLSGKVLRINVDGPDFVSGKEYMIPSDNPFADKTDQGLPEIYAWGLRYPRGCSIERKSSKSGKSGGRIFCGDVGEDTFEEINIIKRKDNYGWNLKQGTADFCPECLRGSPNTKLTDPIFEYRHTIGTSVVGGYVYRGCLNPNLYGQYIFGDFQKGLLRLKEKNKRWTGGRLEMCPDTKCKSPLTNQIQPYIHSFGEDEHGELYVLTTSSPDLRSPTGRIFRIVDPIRRGNPIQCKSARPVDGKSAVTAKFFHNMTPHKKTSDAQTKSPKVAHEVRQQRRPNRRRKPSFLSRLFGRKGKQNRERWNAENRRRGTNLASPESVLNRPDVQQALNDIRNSRTRTSRGHRPNTSHITSISGDSTDVNSILRAAGLMPSQPQTRARANSPRNEGTNRRQSSRTTGGSTSTVNDDAGVTIIRLKRK